MKCHNDRILYERNTILDTWWKTHKDFQDMDMVSKCRCPKYLRTMTT